VTVRSQTHIVICHQLGNGRYKRQDTAVDQVVHEHGHGGHPGDIIPPFHYVLSNGQAGHFDGLNWPGGEATWENGCVRPPTPPGRIVVFGTCITAHGATYDATFGYTSGESASVTIPAGDANHISPSVLQQSQVTAFAPGTTYTAFTVHNIPAGTTATWSVTHNGSESADLNDTAAACGIPTGPAEPIGVFVACVENHGSTYDAVFGYENENAEDVTIPVSIANGFSPGKEDRGQPEVFVPGRVREAFTVTGIPASQELTWTLVSLGTIQTTASARIEVKCHPPIPPPPEPPSPQPPGPPAPPPPASLPIGIFATCVTHHGSRYDATFGYVNENPFPVTVPIGAQNAVIPGPAGRGQPETFHPTFVDAAFTVHGVRTSHAVTWRLVFAGQVRIATATASLPNCLTTPVDPIAGARVSKSVRPRTVALGQRMRFMIVVRNNGSAVIHPASVTDTLPAGQISIVSATSTRGRCRVTTSAGSHRIRCTARTLAPGQSLSVNITARAVSAGSASDRATVAVPHDPTPANNTASATVHIVAPGPPAVTG
jgi:uncharacterized repeat protein (TIGR01451 family)